MQKKHTEEMKDQFEKEIMNSEMWKEKYLESKNSKQMDNGFKNGNENNIIIEEIDEQTPHSNYFQEPEVSKDSKQKTIFTPHQTNGNNLKMIEKFHTL